jgi:cellulose biosynthesis protein BcsQ
MATRISIVSTKGRVGKTTLTANLGSILADLGQRVLLIDDDLQPTLSSYCRILDTVVSATVAYREAASAQQPVHRWEPTRHEPTPSGLESMLSLVRELPIGLDKAALSPADLTRRLRSHE